MATDETPGGVRFLAASFANGPVRAMSQALGRSFMVDGREYALTSMERSLDPDGEITFRFTPVKET